MFIGHVRQRHDLIGCSETRTVGARVVLNASIPMRVFTAEFSNSSSRTGLQFSLCALRLLGLQLHGYTCTHGRQKSAIAIFGVGQVCGSEEGTNVRRLRQRIDIPCNLRHVCRRSAAACLHSVSGSARRRRVHIMLINLSPVPVPVPVFTWQWFPRPSRTAGSGSGTFRIPLLFSGLRRFVKTDMPRSIGKQSGKSVESVLKKIGKWENGQKE